MSHLIESIEDAVYEAVHELTGIDLGNYDEDTPEGAIGARILAVVGEEFEADPKYGVWIKHDGKLKTSQSISSLAPTSLLVRFLTAGRTDHERREVAARLDR